MHRHLLFTAQAAETSIDMIDHPSTVDRAKDQIRSV